MRQKLSDNPPGQGQFLCLLNKSDSFPPSCAEYASLKKAGLGDKKITLNLDYGPLEIDQ